MRRTGDGGPRVCERVDLESLGQPLRARAWVVTTVLRVGNVSRSGKLGLSACGPTRRECVSYPAHLRIAETWRMLLLLLLLLSSLNATGRIQRGKDDPVLRTRYSNQRMTPMFTASEYGCQQD